VKSRESNDNDQGLPAHALLVHVVVVFIPLAAVLLVVMHNGLPQRRTNACNNGGDIASQTISMREAT
jgi:hypothetical protein